MKRLCDFIVQVEPTDSIDTIRKWLLRNTDVPEVYLQSSWLNTVNIGDIFILGILSHVRIIPYQLKRESLIDNEEIREQQEKIQKTIITVGELIRVLQQYNSTFRIEFQTQGSYADHIQISRDDIESDDEGTITILV